MMFSLVFSPSLIPIILSVNEFSKILMFDESKALMP